MKDILGIVRHVDPTLDLSLRQLGMKLDPPRALAESERLRVPGVTRQLDGAVRHRVAVVVPLKRLEPLWEPRENGVVARRRRQLDVVPADLRLVDPEDAGPRSLRK